MVGYIHSLESFGTVDGPGVRYVVFMQGCPMRCQYCHNPDTWETRGGTPVTVDEILKNYNKNKAFYRNGGITVTGGEPLLQIEFVTELFKKAQAQDIHTCLDTSGVTFQPSNLAYLEKLDKLLAVTDLVMLDIKHIRPEQHQTLTGHSNHRILFFARYLDEKRVFMWIRHVVVPGITDNPEDLFELGYFIGSLKFIKSLDVLPYHTMGKDKYKQLGMEYPLGDLEDCTRDQAITARALILDGIRERRRQKTRE